MGEAPSIAPLAVWDTRDFKCSYYNHFPEASEWAQEHIPDCNRVYRAEFYLIDAPFAILYRYAGDENGRVRYDPVTDGPVCDEPVRVLLDALPPEHLREVADGS